MKPLARNSLTERLQISLPLIQAPMAGGATTPELVATVSNAGGLGSLGAGYMPAEEIRKAIKQIKGLTQKPFAVNLFIPQEHSASFEQIERARETIQQACPELNFAVPAISSPYMPAFDEQLTVVLEEQVPVFSFTFGAPKKDWLVKLKQNRTVLIGTATTLEEALYLEALGIDCIAAQGIEAGGHRGTFLLNADQALMGLSALVPLLADHLHTPILASGGIMDARGIKAAHLLGAAGVQMGTAFLTCVESGIHPSYKQLLLDSKTDNTVLTRAFSGKLARGLNNVFIQRMKLNESTILDYPIQNALTSAMRKEAAKQANTQFMSLWAGQAVHLCKHLTAAQLINELVMTSLTNV